METIVQHWFTAGGDTERITEKVFGFYCYVCVHITWNRVDWQLPGMKNSQMKKLWTPDKRTKDTLLDNSHTTTIRIIDNSKIQKKDHSYNTVYIMTNNRESPAHPMQHCSFYSKMILKWFMMISHSKVHIQHNWCWAPTKVVGQLMWTHMYIRGQRSVQLQSCSHGAREGSVSCSKTPQQGRCFLPLCLNPCSQLILLK